MVSYTVNRERFGLAQQKEQKKDAQSELREKRKVVRNIANRLKKVFPERAETERKISFTDTLIAIILSQNTNDRNSHKAYQLLRVNWPNWEEVVEADPADISEAIRVSGLADQKRVAIQGTLRAFQEKWGTVEPEELEEISDDELLEFLTSIKGVGLKSASCAMMFALDRDLCAVDTHLNRIRNRVGVISASSPDKTFRDLRPLIPEGRARELHVNLIYFGREICKARLPHCFECPIFDLCQWGEKEEYAAAKKQGPKAVSGDFLITDGI